MRIAAGIGWVICLNVSEYFSGNILLKSSDQNVESAEFGVIDYEYASYNYRWDDQLGSLMHNHLKKSLC